MNFNYIGVHQPVLLQEVLDIFDPQPGENYIDATINGGGHALAIAEKIGPSGVVLGIDRDCDLIRKLGEKVKKLEIKNVQLFCDNFANIRNIVRRHSLAKVDGVLFDLGFSQYHIEESGRGFSFLRDEPLDMRYSKAETEFTAAKVINEWPVQKLREILERYGEEKFAQRIVKGIAEYRRIKTFNTTAELVKVIKESVPKWYCKRKIHCATKTFQALRITVNDELRFVEEGIKGAIDILSSNGKLIVITFHSLEGRLVKQILREAKNHRLAALLNKKTMRPTFKEILANPRSRSAKLRAIIKV